MMVRSPVGLRVALAVSGALWSSASFAQSAQTEPPPIEPSAPPAQQPGACPSAADTLFSAGIARMSAGDDAAAAVLFGRVLELCPTHPSAAVMRANAEQHARSTHVGAVQVVGTSAAQSSATAGATIGPQPLSNGWPNSTSGGWTGWNAPPAYNLVYGPDPVTVGARVNLVIGQTIVGMAVGAWVPLIVSNRPRGEHIAGGTLLGGALGVTGSLVASLNGITNGQAVIVNMSSLLGLGLGGSLAMLASPSTETTFGLLAGGMAVGTATGAIVAMTRPTSGRMLYFSSMALWGAMLSTHAYFGVAPTSIRIQGVGGFLLGGLLVAGGVGAISAPFVRVSADRMAWINLSMFAGWSVVGLSSMLFASGGSSTLLAYGWGSIAGAALGALLGVLVTRDTDRYWHEVRAQQQPQAGGGSSGAPRVSRTRPTQRPQFVFAPTASAESPLGLTVAGTF